MSGGSGYVFVVMRNFQPGQSSRVLVMFPEKVPSCSIKDFFFFKDRISYSPGWPHPCYVAMNDLEPLNPPSSTSETLRIQVWVAMAGLGKVSRP